MIALRAAAPADCELVWMWNFAADVRAMSGDPTIVELSSHAAWYGLRIADATAPMWIVESARAPVGVVRIDADGRISIALGADARGRGIGRRAITAACEAWGRTVTAEIRHDNAASRACFEACGFVAAADQRDADLITYTWSP
jgi:RimJ/RimL family protein N-acetyltransferase